MDTVETLKKAIALRKPVSYEYNKPGKTPGKRSGNPYVVFVFTAQGGKRSTKLHIVQTTGVSDSENYQPLPSFRTHEIEWLTNMEVLEDRPSFIPNHLDYNPNWEKYDNLIAQV